MDLHVQQDKVIELITITYTSSDNEKIREAYAILMESVLGTYPKSLSQLQQILIKNKDRLDINCKRAFINLIKVSGLQLLASLSLLNKSDDDAISKHKRLLHIIQHIFDNKEIESYLKIPIGELYVELFIFFTPQNYSRLMSKSKYYFNTKQQLLALGLTQAYLHCKTPLKYRFPYCEQSVQLILTNLEKKIEIILTFQTQLSQQDVEVLDRFMVVLRDLWAKMTFEKFQLVFDKILSSSAFSNLISVISHDLFGHSWKKQLYAILDVITFSLGRCNLYQKYASIVQVIRHIIIREFQNFMFGTLSDLEREQQVVTLSLLASAIQYKLIEIKVSSFDLFTKVIYPNYLAFEKYLKNQANNLPQVVNFLDDASFYMQSQAPEILRHKILMELCKNSEQISMSFKSLIYTFYCKHISRIANEQVREVAFNLNIQEGMQVWDKIKQLISQFDQIEVILLYTALSASFFISDLDFIKKIEEFVCQNEEYLLENSNKKIIFYSVLLYKNYMDDIFSTNSSVGYRERIILYALDNCEENKIIKDLALETMKEKLTQKPSYEQFAKQIEMFLQKMMQSYQEDLISITKIIFREYGEYIKSETAIHIIQITLEVWKKRQIHQDKQSEYLELLKLFLNINSCSQYFFYLLEELLRIANENVREVQNHIEQFLDVMKVGLQVCNKLPPNFQETIIKFTISINSIQSMQIINQFISYSDNSQFFNWLVVILTKNNLNIYETLLIHNLIYYGNRHLSYGSIRILIEHAYLERVHKKYQFDYRNGKINLIFLFLMKYAWKEMNDLLLNEDWSYLIQKGKLLLKNVQKMGRNVDIGLKPFIEEIYDLIYLQENIYRWKYDIEMFLILQLDLFKHQIKDKYQFIYANLTFIACTMNILRAFDFIQNHQIEDGSESDDSLHPHSKLEKEYRGVQQIVDHFIVPVHLKEVNYFTIFRNTIINLRKDANSNKWLQTLYEVSFKEDHIAAFQCVMKMEKNPEGNYRKIARIKRIKGQDNDL